MRERCKEEEDERDVRRERMRERCKEGEDEREM